MSHRTWLREAARDLRRRSTPTQQLLWDALRRHRVAGRQFRRQRPIGPYIADFLCVSARLVVEVDGPIHDHQRDDDEARDEYLEELGYTVLRIPADRVVNDLAGVLSQIARACAALPLSREAGEGVGGRGHTSERGTKGKESHVPR
jgi:very-short-patch-repair endonuclease